MTLEDVAGKNHRRRYGCFLRWRVAGKICAAYSLSQVQLEGNKILHAAPNQSDVRTGTYTETHGWVKKHSGGTVEFWYNNTRYLLLLNDADKTVEIFTATVVRSWVGSLRRRFDEWGSPLEFAIGDPKSSLPIAPISIIAMGSDCLRAFFR